MKLLNKLLETLRSALRPSDGHTSHDLYTVQQNSTFDVLSIKRIPLLFFQSERLDVMLERSDWNLRD